MRDRIDRFLREFPATYGLSASGLNRWVKAHNAMIAALAGVERVIASEHPEFSNQAISIAHEVYSTWSPFQGQVPRSAPLLTRKQWVHYGFVVKVIHADLQLLLMEFRLAQGATKVYLGKFLAVERCS